MDEVGQAGNGASASAEMSASIMPAYRAGVERAGVDRAGVTADAHLPLPSHVELLESLRVARGGAAFRPANGSEVRIGSVDHAGTHEAASRDSYPQVNRLGGQPGPMAGDQPADGGMTTGHQAATGAYGPRASGYAGSAAVPGHPEAARQDAGMARGSSQVSGPPRRTDADNALEEDTLETARVMVPHPRRAYVDPSPSAEGERAYPSTLSRTHAVPDPPVTGEAGEADTIDSEIDDVGADPVSGAHAPNAHVPSAHAPNAHAPNAHAPNAHAPNAHAPNANSPGAQAHDVGPQASRANEAAARTGDGETEAALAGERFAPDGFASDSPGAVPSGRPLPAPVYQPAEPHRHAEEARNGTRYSPSSDGAAYATATFPARRDPAAEPVAVGAAHHDSGSQAVPAGGVDPLDPSVPVEDVEASLPHRVPAPPDVPDVPGSDDDYLDDDDEIPGDVDGGSLTRIASGLRTDARSAIPDDLDVNAVLAAVRQVEGVQDARLRGAPGEVQTLRLELADGADPGLVSRTVARLLKERMGIAAQPRRSAAVDEATRPAGADARRTPEYRAGRPDAAGGDPIRRQAARADATAAPRHTDGSRRAAQPQSRPGSNRYADRPASLSDAPAPQPHPTGAPALAHPRGTSSRVILDRVKVATIGTEATVEVNLAATTGNFVGTASGPAVDGYLLRLAAQAAAGAIDSLMAATSGRGGGETGPVRCFIDHAGVVPFGSCLVAIAVVLVSGDGWVEQLVGSALVAGDPRQAIVRATLAAVNRRLSILLG